MVNSTDFAAFIKFHRRMTEQTLNDISLKTGISIAHYSDLEHSRRHLTKKNTLEKMAKALQLSEKDTIFFFQIAEKSQAAAIAEKELPEYVVEQHAV
jgi:transcriptional regulator with XRE-family HTH domain